MLTNILVVLGFVIHLVIFIYIVGISCIWLKSDYKEQRRRGAILLIMAFVWELWIFYYIGLAISVLLDKEAQDV